MKPKLVVVVIVLLLVAMVPALAMAKSQAKPSKTGSVVLDTRQPLGPQLDAQMGEGKNGPRSASAFDSRIASRGGAQSRAVYGLLLDNFEAPWAEGLNWGFGELGFSPVGWDITDIESRGGNWSLYSAGWWNDPWSNPYYDNDMYSYAEYPMDLQGAQRVQVRFYYMSDTEYGWDTFYWCSYDGWFTLYCDYFTGSTNGKWRQVKIDSNKSAALSESLGSPFASFVFLFESDSSVVERGTFVDQMLIRAWGPQPSN